MPRIMMICTRKGEQIYTGLDLPEKSPLNVYAQNTINCPSCGQRHPLRKLFFEGDAIKDRHKFNVALESTPTFAADIGILISCFALIEGYIPQLMAKLMNIGEEDAFTITGRFQMGERLRLLGDLAKLRNADHRPKIAIERFHPRLEEATKIRNKYVHASYSVTFNDAVVVNSWANDSKRKSKERITEDVNFISNEIEQLQTLICDLHGFIYRDEMPLS